MSSAWPLSHFLDIPQPGIWRVAMRLGGSSLLWRLQLQARQQTQQRDFELKLDKTMYKLWVETRSIPSDLIVDPGLLTSRLCWSTGNVPSVIHAMSALSKTFFFISAEHLGQILAWKTSATSRRNSPEARLWVFPKTRKMVPRTPKLSRRNWNDSSDVAESLPLVSN